MQYLFNLLNQLKMTKYILLEDLTYHTLDTVEASDIETAFQYFVKRHDRVSKDNIFTQEELDQEIDLLRLEAIGY